VASRVIGWPETSDYIGSRREIKEWISVSIGSPLDRMKLLGSHTTTERTSRKQEQEFRMAQKRGGLAGLGKRQGKSVRLCWAGNRSVMERGQVSESQVCGGG
jgi:hypothetical protein